MTLAASTRPLLMLMMIMRMRMRMLMLMMIMRMRMLMLMLMMIMRMRMRMLMLMLIMRMRMRMLMLMMLLLLGNNIDMSERSLVFWLSCEKIKPAFDRRYVKKWLGRRAPAGRNQKFISREWFLSFFCSFSSFPFSFLSFASRWPLRSS